MKMKGQNVIELTVTEDYWRQPALLTDNDPLRSIDDLLVCCRDNVRTKTGGRAARTLCSQKQLYRVIGWTSSVTRI